MTHDVTPGMAPFFYMVTFEIAPEDEHDFNEIYDTEHIPRATTMSLPPPGASGTIRRTGFSGHLLD